MFTCNRYLIPGKNGNLEQGTRHYNWVWYRQYPEGSTELREIMTDKDGKEHRSTLPTGKMRDEVMDQQKTLARELLSPATAELVLKTKNAFIQAIADVISPRASFLDGRVLLVGDALATFRPMTGLGTNQAARQALSLFEVLAGRLSLEEWERDALEYAQATRALGIARERLFHLG
jgi:2-polyprenyl-6-methoxyphenol hydroxylase-like FAD-dependent oxidoreductase